MLVFYNLEDKIKLKKLFLMCKTITIKTNLIYWLK